MYHTLLCTAQLSEKYQTHSPFGQNCIAQQHCMYIDCIISTAAIMQILAALKTLTHVGKGPCQTLHTYWLGQGALAMLPYSQQASPEHS